MPTSEMYRYSAAKFLNEVYKVDRDSFLYESSYNVFSKYSPLSKLYIDLGNYLSGRDRRLWPLHNATQLLDFDFALVCFSCGLLSPTSLHNPNDLQPDREDKSFHCFSIFKVEILPPPSCEDVRTFRSFMCLKPPNALTLYCNSCRISSYSQCRKRRYRWVATVNHASSTRHRSE
jgi:hypothetical protein